jgi:alkylated DNA nucleotide flippase Atl1
MNRQPTIKVLARAKGAAFPAGRMLIASPDALRAVIDTIPRGRVLRLGALRAELARQWQADYTCPVTTGICLRLVAEEAVLQPSPTPYWRVVRDNGALFEKFPGGVRMQVERLTQEGVHIDAKTRVPRVLEVATDALRSTEHTLSVKAARRRGRPASRHRPLE